MIYLGIDLSDAPDLDRGFGLVSSRQGGSLWPPSVVRLRQRAPT